MRSVYGSIIVATLVALLITPIIIKLAVKFNAVDKPKPQGRKIHKKPIPLLGGTAIYIAFITGVILKNGLLMTEEIGVIIGATIIVLGGIWDDLKEIRPKTKLLIQLSAAIVLIMSGTQIQRITNPFSDMSIYLNIKYLSIPFTILWVIGITNAFNLIDGLDGLSAGVGFISSFTIMVIALMNSRVDAALMTGILCGSILGFLPYNFNPASIFMGDTGAQLLGFLLAAISIQGAIKSAATVAIAVPILAFGLPIYDTLFAMIRRKINGKPISQADRGHLHHRLLDLGLSQKQAVIVMYIFSAILGFIAIIVMQVSNRRAYFILASVIIFIFLFAYKCNFFKTSEEK